ncbi:MAG TPA: hypothetical protein P5555_18085, partial [Candidatus Paceibacterota bacterium]|nr:hypothetical protein [Verrucomicrobiota bacterium]HRZ47092.1 hypothetical protein [Candidatus Paceibacterota bacterium]HRZ93592.1 hypothetical protein [Candidatus Paceibacterota bacterium]
MGKAAFIGAFVALIMLLASLPAKMLGETERRLPLWRNVRAWAILVAVAQILIYSLWGRCDPGRISVSCRAVYAAAMTTT